MLANDARLASVSSSSCRSRRECAWYSSVMSSSRRTKPVSAGPSDAAGRTGAMLTRRRCPAGVPVTNRADDRRGVAAPGDAPLHRFERMRDQRAVYDAVD